MPKLFHQRGVSLVEVLIALLIGLIVAASLASIFAQSVRTREKVNRDSQKLENGRYALETISDDIRLAGYFGELMLPVPISWQIPNPCETAVTSLGWNAGAEPKQIPVPLFGYDAHGVTPTIPDCSISGGFLPNRKAGTDVLVVRRVSTDDPVAPSSVSGSAYLQVSTQNPFCSPPDGSTYVVSSSSSQLTLHQLKQGTSGCTELAKARKLVVRTYYVATCNVCSPSDDIPTLKVAELDNGAIAYRSITPGIDDLHVEYGVDSAGTDGSTDEYLLSANNGTLTGGKNWGDVVAARVFVLAKDLDPTLGYSNTTTYQLGSKTSSVSDDYKRAMMATTVRAINMAGRRGAP